MLADRRGSRGKVFRCNLGASRPGDGRVMLDPGIEGAADRDELVFAELECLDDIGIELRAGAVEDDRTGLLVAESVLIDAFAGEGVEHVREGDDSAAERNV